MSQKVIKWAARQIARAYGVDPKIVEQALWDAIDMQDEIANRYPA